MTMNDNDPNFSEAEVRQLSNEALELERTLLVTMLPTLRGKDTRIALAALLGITAALAGSIKLDPDLYRQMVEAMADVVAANHDELVGSDA